MQLVMLALLVCLVARQTLELLVRRVVLAMLEPLEQLEHLVPHQALALLVRQVMLVPREQLERLVARQIQVPRVK